VAEWMIDRTVFDSGIRSAEQDMKLHDGILNDLCSNDNEKSDMETDMRKRCFDEVQKSWPAIDEVARALLNKGTLKHQEVVAICKKHNLRL
jgi:hypothetical protein